MFTYYEPYQVLLCREHCCAVYGLDKHLKQQHGMPAVKRRALLATYKGINLLPPAEVAQPAPYGPPIDALGPAHDAFLCYCSSSSSSASSSNNRDSNSAACGFITISRAKMQQHVNQQHSIKLTRWSSPAAALYRDHAAQLWKPVKVQSFFRERRYVKYFVVQENAQEQQGDAQQGNKQQGDAHQGDKQQGDAQQGDKQQGDAQQGDKQQGDAHQGDKRQGDAQQGDKQQEWEQQSDYKQALSYLSSSLAALKRKDSEAIDCIAEQTLAKDRTGWFKRTRWDEHLQAYPDWKLLAYAVRPAGDNEPALKQVVLAVEEVVGQAVRGLSTLSQGPNWNQPWVQF
jgi:hypothetical protein